MITLSVVVLVIVLANRTGDDSPIVADYTLEVFTSDYCDDFYGTGYDDIPYAEVVVIDGEGNVLGVSSLDGGYDTDQSCVFSASFEIERSADGIYRITAGNSNRGYVNFQDGDIRNRRLVMEASLGN